MSLLGKSINEVIQTIYETIKSKRDVISTIQSEYLTSNLSAMSISISRFKLIDLLDEFEITISRSLQGIQTLQTEICNLQEAQRESFKAQIPSLHQDNQACLSTILPHNMNDDMLFDSIQTNNNPINNSINESVSIITSHSQVYHKPKATKPLNSTSSSRLKFDYDIGTHFNTPLYKNNTTPDCDIPFNSNNSPMAMAMNTNMSKNEQINDLLISYSEIEGEPIEHDKARLPIRQSIRAGLNKQSSINKVNHNDSKENINNTTNSRSNSKRASTNTSKDNSSKKKEEIMSKLTQIESEKSYQSMLRKISQKEAYKLFFADKYGKGNYEEFVRQCNRKEISFSDIQKEFSIMEYITKAEEKKNSGLTQSNIKKETFTLSNSMKSHNSNATTVNNNSMTVDVEKNNSNMINDPPKIKRKSSINKTETSFTMKNTPPHKDMLINQSNPYIEPIRFSSNYLRGSSTSKSQRSNSKPNKDKQPILSNSIK